MYCQMKTYNKHLNEPPINPNSTLDKIPPELKYNFWLDQMSSLWFCVVVVLFWLFILCLIPNMGPNMGGAFWKNV